MPRGARAVRGARAALGARASAGLLLALTAVFTQTAAGPGSATGAPGLPRAAAEGADPIDFAVVVDQSSSLSDKDLAREVEAAALIGQGEISERSRATVIGFGSSEKPGQSAVREVCEPTVVDAAGRNRLSDCVKELSRRDSERMGPGTDFPAALRQAVNRLGGEDGRPATPKVVFLLTDGRLDVRDSPEYGPDAASRQAEAAKQLTEELGRAREESVQIWPLGFGQEIDRGALGDMAAGGFRGGCADLPSATPRMRVVDSSAEIDKVLQETFAAARCAQVVQGEVGKPPTDLTVTIPKIATDGSITVSKHDPKVTATYYDPRGRKVPTRGSYDGSTFEATGQNGPVEALRVKNPRPGKWRVHLEAPDGHRGREVAVRAIWQGRLRSAVTLDPASPRPGERAVVEVRMQTRRGVVIDDPDELKGVEVAARLSGSGFDAVTVPLSDDGKAPDARAGDVRFTGRLTVPSSADGDLALTAEMTAPGVTGDHRPLNARISAGTSPVAASLTVARDSVHPGGVIEGTLDVSNKDQGTHRLRLAVTDPPPGGGLRISPGTVEVAAGEERSVPLRLTLGSGVPIGEIGSRITVTDTDDEGRALDTVFVGVPVEPTPTWWDRWWGAVLAAAALALAVAVFLGVRMTALRRRRDLTGVRLELRGEGLRPDELTVRSGQSPGGAFHFVVDRSRGAAPSLARAGSGQGGAYRLRRTAAGEFLLRPRQGRERSLRAGEPAGLGDGLELVVHDRRTAGGPEDARGARGARGSRSAGAGTGRRDRPADRNRAVGGDGYGERDRYGERDGYGERGRDREGAGAGSRDTARADDRDGGRDRDGDRDQERRRGGWGGWGGLRGRRRGAATRRDGDGRPEDGRDGRRGDGSRRDGRRGDERARDDRGRGEGRGGGRRHDSGGPAGSDGQAAGSPGRFDPNF
ncbi:VWA domain-containing protein [Streptomyces sp. NRRL F-5135]|uniref:VWA domain-containing protein n=1 Tax=Streptomyces sp. NRRL F-5135 TaxID=1463858 RepID=UPI0007C5288F|nr:VWA domain-containing protein [Streptomyces sp. NRRL F-5135]